MDPGKTSEHHDQIAGQRAADPRIGVLPGDGFCFCLYKEKALRTHIWVVVKIMVPFRVLNIVRHLLFRVPKKGP